MKRKRREVVERRRPLVEINLAAEAKSRPALMARRGCALFGTIAAVLAVSSAAWLGLH